MKSSITIGYVLLVALLLIQCTNRQKNLQKLRLDNFVWIEHNANWIRDTSQLKARIIIIYNDSSNQISMAKQYISQNRCEFFTTKLSDSLENLIAKSLYNKSYSSNYRMHFTKDNMIPYIYDGDVYLMIYKFSNQPEKFINYIPRELPDSLVAITDYLDKLTRRKGLNPGAQFDINGLFNKYKHYYLENLMLPPELSVDSINTLTK